MDPVTAMVNIVETWLLLWFALMVLFLLFIVWPSVLVIVSVLMAMRLTWRRTKS